MDPRSPSPQYVQARRVLLDALEALGPHSEALVLSGAQAVYVRTGPNPLPVAEHTLDGDLAIDPALLRDAPLLGELMEAAGFEPAEQGNGVDPGIWQKTVKIGDVAFPVPVDLIVPAGAALQGGRRGARLGPHGNQAARKIPGMEAVLVDNDPLLIAALEAGDQRQHRLRVAGSAALLVAKTHKLLDRLEDDKPHRLDDKDAADVFRLMQTNSPASIATKLRGLIDHPAAGDSTAEAIERFPALFGTRAAPGIAMAARSLRTAVPEDRVKAVCLAYCKELRSLLTRPSRDLSLS
ncbi:MAG TPA: hypothetical protein VGV69_00205 [Solirubrobacterales bacterium]|nr:hypothetical protein [Solirubrobacterales bacterium]